jgi:type I restriction enzyme, S subunit
VLRLADLSDGIFLPTEPRKIRLTASERTKYALSPGDLVCIRVNGSEKLVGRMLTWQARSGWCYCDHFIRFKLVTDCADPDYVALFFATADLRHRIETSFVSSAGQKTVNQKILGNLAIPLPPLPEQRRIVAKLDRLSARSRAARDHLAHTAKLAARAKQAILARQIDENPAGPRPISWLTRSLDQGWSPKCEGRSARGDHEWGVIKTTAVQAINFAPEENKALPAALTPRPNLQIAVGDVLITRAGPRSRVAIACLVRRTRSQLMLCDKVYRLRVHERRALPEFLTLALNSPATLQSLEELKTGINDSGLNLTQDRFLGLEIPAPSIEEQRQIVRRIEAAFARIDRLTAEAARAAHLLDRLDERLLAKAFRGELVDQDPADEPAEVLLARIRAGRAESPRPRRGRRARVS